jgi:hypothetical protein
MFMDEDPLHTQSENILVQIPEDDVEPLPDAIQAATAYDLVVQHRKQRFNSIEVL